MDMNFLDTNSLIQGLNLPSLPVFGFSRIVILIVLLLVIIFWGNKTLKDMVRIVAVIALIAVLFGFINV